MHDEPAQAVQGDGGSREIASGLDLKPLGTIPLSAAHNVKDFTSRSARVQGFIRDDEGGLIANGYCRVFVWPDPSDPSKILGFYSLAPCSIERAELINRHERKAPHGIPVPMALIGFMGRAPSTPTGFGAVLIHDAALRVSRVHDLRCWGLALHPENTQLAKRYAEMGFNPGRASSRDSNKRLVMYGPLSAFLEPDSKLAAEMAGAISQK